MIVVAPALPRVLLPAVLGVPAAAPVSAADADVDAADAAGAAPELLALLPSPASD